MTIYRTESACRSCGSGALTDVLDLGVSPLADRLPSLERLGDGDPEAPLTLALCTECALAQIRETVDPEVLFCDEYPYFSSVSPSLVAHFGASAESIIKTRELGPESFVVEAASNDGYMLANFRRHGCRVLGIDPADGPAAKAVERGIDTLNTFFTAALAREIRNQHPAGADVFLANNVLAHVPDLNGFAAGIAHMLADDGVAVIEAPYLVDLVEHLEFDTIYHQHLCYFSVTALDRLWRRHGLFLNDVERTAIHGGSLRLFVEKTETPTARVRELLAAEREAGVDTPAYFAGFAERVGRLRDSLRELLESVRRDGLRLAGYGAAAKATTLLSFCGIGADTLEFIADRNAFKQGRFMGKNHIPILGPDEVMKRRPDVLLILAWNFADEIRRDMSEFESAGGRFLVPVPEPVLL